jgi:hypothetical protein
MNAKLLGESKHLFVEAREHLQNILQRHAAPGKSLDPDTADLVQAVSKLTMIVDALAADEGVTVVEVG